jgi:hypothetical protein
MSTEGAASLNTAADTWRPLVMEAMPLRFGIRFGALLEAVHPDWEAMDSPPCTALATAVTALACTGELEINDEIIRRGQTLNEQAQISG